MLNLPFNIKRSPDNITYEDRYLAVSKRLGIPTGPVDSLDAETGANSVMRLFFNTTLNTLRVYDPIEEEWKDATSLDFLNNYYNKTEIDSMFTANSLADRNRANHTGTQPISTIVNLQSTLDGLVPKTTTITGGSGIDVGGSLSSGSVNISINDNYLNNRYLRKDVDDDNGTNTLTLGKLITPVAEIESLILASLPLGTQADQVLTVDASGNVRRITPQANVDIGIANSGGDVQFSVGAEDDIRFAGGGDTTISFNAATKTLTFTSIPGSGTGGAVTSFNGRTGGVVSVSGDYNTAQVTETTNLYFTEARVRSTPLVGLTLSTTPITATDTIIQAFGKAQGQLNSKVGNSRNLTVSGTAGRIIVSGGEQNLSQDREWVIDLFTLGVSPNVYTKVTVDAYGRVTAGANLAASDIPNLPASKITSGTFALARLGTGTAAAGTYVDGGTGAWTALPSYSAGPGLTLSGTTFSLPVTISGTGSFVQSVAQNTNGITVTLGTPPNTTYTGSNGINVSGTVISPTYGTTAGTIAQGNDSRINNGQTAYGWGNHADRGYLRYATNIPTGADLDDYLSTGVYSINSSTAPSVLNKPTDLGQTATLEVLYSGTYVIQKYFVSSGAHANYTWFRTRNSGGWNNWVLQYSDNIFTADDIAKWNSAYPRLGDNNTGVPAVQDSSTMNDKLYGFGYSAGAEGQPGVAGAYLSAVHSNGYGYQLHGRSENLRVRFSENSVWSDWRDIWHDGNLTQSSINNWNTAFGWGNHANKYVGSGPGNSSSLGTYTGDLNSIKQSEVYASFISTTASNTPFGNVGGFLNFGLSSGITSQLLMSRDGNNLAFRGDSNGSNMSPWRIVYHSGNLRSDAQNDARYLQLTGGTVTGTITAPTFSGALSGNATTATRLATARTINGTSFNGSTNIVTSSWGSGRNITIGDATKYVNGSTNISWSLSEIGALPLTGGTVTGVIKSPAPVANADLANKAYVDSQSVIESNGFGYSIRGRNQGNYGNPGSNAFDFSYSDAASTTKGATGYRATAFGSNTTASGNTSFVAGNDGIASGGSSIALGFQPTASGAFSIALGYLSIASQNYSIALSGGRATASGSIAIKGEANGTNSISIGTGAFSNAQSSITIGTSITNNSYGSLVIGQLNDPIITTPQTTWVVGSPLLVAGNGINAINRSNAYVLYNDGRSEQIKDMEVTEIGQGFVLKSPDGTRWRITVDNGGNLITTAL